MLKTIIIANIMKLSVPLGMFVWALFMPRIATYSYIAVYMLFAGYLILIDKLKPNPDPEKWANEEIEVLRKYHLALRFPFGSKDMSLFLNGFRWGSFFWVILLLFRQEWLAVAFLIFAFFFTAGISVRLDPFFFLGNAVQSGQMQFMHELSILQIMAKKFNAKQTNTFEKGKVPKSEESKLEKVSAKEFSKAKEASDEAWRKLGKEPNPFE